MRALLLAAGFGTRLGRLTAERPKPLIKVGDKPILEFCLGQLSSAGVTEVVINTHYRAPMVEAFISSFKSDLKITLSHEVELLGTAGTLKTHIDFLSQDDFIVMHADNYFAYPMSRFISAHQSRKVGDFGSIGTFDTDNPMDCGVIVLNNDQTISEFHEKVSNPPSVIANTAIYAFTPKVREVLSSLSREENNISTHLIPKIATRLYAHKFEGLFVDIGTPEGLNKANAYAKELSRS